MGLQASLGLFRQADLPNLVQCEFVWPALASSSTKDAPVESLFQASQAFQFAML